MLKGKWWLIQEGEGFDSDYSLSMELGEGRLVTGEGDEGRYESEGDELRLWLPFDEGEGTILRTDQGSESFTGYNPLVSPVWLCKDGPWVAKLTSENRAEER